MRPLTSTRLYCSSILPPGTYTSGARISAGNEFSHSMTGVAAYEWSTCTSGDSMERTASSGTHSFCCDGSSRTRTLISGCPSNIVDVKGWSRDSVSDRQASYPGPPGILQCCVNERRSSIARSASNSRSIDDWIPAGEESFLEDGRKKEHDAKRKRKVISAVRAFNKP